MNTILLSPISGHEDEDDASKFNVWGYTDNKCIQLVMGNR